MSRVTYLIGAGASYGTRGTDANGKKLFTRGLPVINELAEAVDALIPRNMSGRVQMSPEDAKSLGIMYQDYLKLVQGLLQLEEMCESYPTIDTLAKQLFVTNRSFLSKNGNPVDYQRLKTLLAMAILMMQGESHRDLRYDGFIASLIRADRTFPPMTILSWNYDAQFEIAYSGYYRESRYIPSLWQELNVLNKTYPTDFDDHAPFAMIKLNGTAFFTDMTHPVVVNGHEVAGLRDCFFGGDKQNLYQYGAEYLNKSIYHNTLSYAWEQDKFEQLKQPISNRVADTEELIVIGYSFPYVNNEIDSYIIQRMWHLQKVHIQDMNFTDVKERIEAILQPTGRSVEFSHKQNLNQFYIPNQF